MRPVSKGLKTFTAILICIIIIVAAGSAILLYSQYVNRSKPIIKKAFVIVPDFMGSNLLDPENDNSLAWSADPTWILEKQEEDSSFLSTYMQSIFRFDEECNPTKNLVPVYKGNNSYGFNGDTKKLTDYLKSQYADDGYEVVTWQYDWRQSNLVSAQKLEKFVEQEGYTNIIFISHGMGGNVVAKYITKAANRIKVDLFIPIAAPFLGSLGTIDWLFGKEESVEGYVNTQYSQLMQTLGIYKYLSDIPSLAQLVPYPASWQLSAYGSNNAPILFNGSKIMYNEVYQYFCSLDFAKTESASLKPVYKDLVEHQSKDYIKQNGKFLHITEYVNTVYVVGTGVDTRNIANINTATGMISNIEHSNLGDGLVWAYSATAGKSLKSNNVITVDINEIDYLSHDGLLYCDEVIELIKPVIADKILR